MSVPAPLFGVERVVTELTFSFVTLLARMRRKKQALTDRFFETKRRSSAPGPGSGAGSGAGGGALVNRVSAAPGSLASRVGVAKVLSCSLFQS